eukprot:TRINITY_DN29250_c0_g1_i1.p1 TRINITY_DN29250_c0_g1~~TRINITY_DN29250_c0_g1_i1.p1  ORF type:complete len:850 (-),score=138.34 TRINITY_DN29250_c0_g1_i1:42-2537(-)
MENQDPAPSLVPRSDKTQQSEIPKVAREVWVSADHCDENEKKLGSQTLGSAGSSGGTMGRIMNQEIDLDAFPGIVWQWHHRTGWRDYDQRTIVKIEAAYRNGESKVRVQTGKHCSTPMEMFFEDMIQHDPISHNHREIRRVGKWTCRDRIRRYVGGWIRMLETGRPRREVFAEYERRRQALHDNIDKPEYDVATYYKADSCLASIASSSMFFTVTMIAVMLNTLWLSIDSDYNNAATLDSSDVLFQVVEHLFCVFFTLELLIRLGAFNRKRDCLRDSWFCFDLVLVLIMILEIWLLPLVLFATGESSENTIKSFTALRLMRLLRLTRIARLLRALPEMLTLLKGITMAFRGVATTVCLLGILTFVFAIIFKKQSQVVQEDGELSTVYFSSVYQSMITLLFVATLLDGPAELYRKVDADLGRAMAVVFLIFIFFSAFTILNMLIGVVCQVITEVSEAEKEETQIAYLKAHLMDILECYDVYNDHTIGRNEFELLNANLEMREAMAKFGTDHEDLAVLADILFSKSQNGRLSFRTVLNLILRLKGGNTAQVTDVVDLRDYMRQRSDALEQTLCKLTGQTFLGKTSRHEDKTHEERRAGDSKGEGSIKEHAKPALQVIIQSARGLRNADVTLFNGKSDCLCRCTLLGKAHSMVETQVKNDTLSPEWNEQFVIMQYTTGDSIEFSVFDADTCPITGSVSSLDRLGSVVLQAERFESDGFEGELQLSGAGQNENAFLKVKVEVCTPKEKDALVSKVSDLPHSQSEAPKPPELAKPQQRQRPGETRSLLELLGEICDGQQSMRAEMAELGERLQRVEQSLGRQSCGRPEHKYMDAHA